MFYLNFYIINIILLDKFSINRGYVTHLRYITPARREGFYYIYM